MLKLFIFVSPECTAMLGREPTLNKSMMNSQIAIYVVKNLKNNDNIEYGIYSELLGPINWFQRAGSAVSVL